MLVAKIAAVASLLAGVIAVPVADVEVKAKVEAGTHQLAKRGEGIHLVNCADRYSAVIYCANDSNCNSNPGPGNQCIPTTGNVFTWEGGKKSCKFDTGTAFSFNINGGAQSQANYVNVGSGDNSYHSFNIFKDDKHVMYTDGNGNQCRSIYYCLPA